MTEAADLVIGTSSDASAAAHVRSGIPPAELLAAVLSAPVRPVEQNRERPPSLPVATVFERMRAIGAATSAADRDIAREGETHERCIDVGARPPSVSGD